MYGTVEGVSINTVNQSGSIHQHIATYEYDALGQLKKKKLAPEYNNNQGLEALTNEYNIRGWLTSINKGYVNNSQQAWFGMELGYDKDGNTSFPYKQYNGNIAGTIWRSKGDGVRRKYDFEYDNVNRLGKATYSQNTSSSIWEASTMNYSVHGLDADNGYNIKYDANGNIQGMVSHGFKPGNATGNLDALRYYYVSNSNKLDHVHDDYSDINTKLGDFHDGNNGYMATDYNYDPNGNLTIDHNKFIGSIAYNHLNLPVNISVNKPDLTSKGSIEYVYDAMGTKLKKIVHENGKPDKTTLYIGPFIYEDNQLQLISHEEGRIRLTRNASNQPSGFTFDYFVKDHLGNTRVVLTQEQQTDQYQQLNFDGDQDQINRQNAVWENKNGGSIDVTGVRVNKPANFGSTEDNGYYSMLVRKSTGAIGAGKLLKVMSGDRIHTYVEYYYTATNANNTPANGINSLINNLLGALSTSSAIGGLLKGNPADLTTPLNSNTDLINILNTAPTTGGGNQAPKAYLNIIFFDERFTFDKDASVVVPVAYNPNVEQYIDKRFSEALEARKSGYVYVYFSNESEEMVYFDNFILTHERGPLLEETHYYPFGLSMAGISSKAMGKLENKYKFNSGTELQNKEFSDGSGLELYDAMFRMQDPQLGRFWQIDPLTMASVSVTPYHYANNNPILFNDPFGLDTVRVTGEGSHKIKVAQGDVLAWTIGKTTSYYTYDPGNENAVGGFVGGGIDDGSMDAVTVTGRKGDNTSAWGLGVQWLTGSGPRNHQFRDGDPFTRALQKHGHIADTRSSISSGIASGSIVANRTYNNNYGLGGIAGVPKYLRDYSTLITGGLTGNIAVTYLGSYGLKYEVISIDEQSGTAQVRFYVSNSSTIESGLRPPVIGYTSAWKNTVGKVLNGAFSSGPLSRTTQSVEWTETIKWK